MATPEQIETLVRQAQREGQAATGAKSNPARVAQRVERSLRDTAAPDELQTVMKQVRQFLKMEPADPVTPPIVESPTAPKQQEQEAKPVESESDSRFGGIDTTASTGISGPMTPEEKAAVEGLGTVMGFLGRVGGFLGSVPVGISNLAEAFGATRSIDPSKAGYSQAYRDAVKDMPRLSAQLEAITQAMQEEAAARGLHQPPSAAAKFFGALAPRTYVNSLFGSAPKTPEIDPFDPFDPLTIEDLHLGVNVTPETANTLTMSQEDRERQAHQMELGVTMPPEGFPGATYHAPSFIGQPVPPGYDPVTGLMSGYDVNAVAEALGISSEAVAALDALASGFDMAGGVGGVGGADMGDGSGVGGGQGAPGDTEGGEK